MNKVLVIDSNFDRSQRVIIVRNGIQREYRAHGESCSRIWEVARKFKKTYYKMTAFHAYEFEF